MTIWALADMHVLHLAAYERFIQFNRPPVAAYLDNGLVLHSFPNAVQHEPRRLLGYANRAVKLVAANSVLGVANQPDRRHPLVQPNRGILKNRADLDCELLLAAIAEPEQTRLYKRIAFRAAPGAHNVAIRPAEKLCIFKSAIHVGEVSDCLLEGYGFVHASHILSRSRIARFALCVKYIIALSSHCSATHSADSVRARSPSQATAAIAGAVLRPSRFGGAPSPIHTQQKRLIC